MTKTTILKYSICFLPIAIIIGKAAVNINIVFINLLFLFSFEKKNFKKYFFNKIFLFFFSFVLTIFILSFFSKYLNLKEKFEILFFFRFLILSCAIFYVLDEQQSFIKIFKNILISTFIILIFFSFLEYFFSNILFFNMQDNRSSSLFADYQILGSYLARLSPLLLGLFLYDFKFSKINLIKFFLFYFLVLFTIFFSSERMALGLFILSTVIFLIFFPINFRQKIIFLFSFFFLLGFIIFNVPSIKMRFVTQTLSHLGLHKDKGYRELNFNNIPMYLYTPKKIVIFSNKHDALIRSGYKIFLNNFLYGAGARSFQIACNADENQVIKNEEVYYNAQIFNLVDNDIVILNSKLKIHILYEKNVPKIRTSLLNDNSKISTLKFKDEIIFNQQIDADIKIRINNEFVLGHWGNEVSFSSVDSDKLLELTSLFEKKLIENKINYKKHLIKKVPIPGVTITDGCSTHPHNILIQFAAEFGITGLSFLILFYCYLVKLCFEFYKKKNFLYFSVVVSLIIAVWPIGISANFFSTIASTMNFIFIGFLMYQQNKQY